MDETLTLIDELFDPQIIYIHLLIISAALVF